MIFFSNLLKNGIKTMQTRKNFVSRWSPLEKAFNSRPNLSVNPISRDVGLFGVPELNSCEGFYHLTNGCIQQTAGLINEALSTSRNRKIVEVFDELSDSLCQVADLAEFIRFAHPSNDYVNAAEESSITISGLVEKLNTNVKLYEALREAVKNGDIVPTTDVDNLVGNLYLFDFEQSGIHLPKDKRNKVVELNNNILYLGQKFVHGIAKPRIVNRKIIPEAITTMFSGSGDNIAFSSLHADSSSALVREVAYKIFLYPDDEQELILTQLLTNRNEMANICGFQTYAERALRGSILSDPDIVNQFLNHVSNDIKDKAQCDFSDMTNLKKSESPRAGPLSIWDVSYFTQKAKKERFEVSSKEYSPFFSLGACMEGLNIIFSSLYGISLVNSEIQLGETWSKDVYKLSVEHETEGVLGYIYCDFYERLSKPNQDCHFTIRCGKILSDGTYQLPIVVLMLNLPLPRWSNPTLLTPNMVDNLFHEMGHAMHSMLARTQYQHVSGTRCSTDLAEMPSILMEYFASDRRIVKLFAKHFQTKEPISDDMLDRLCASKRLFSASEVQLQLFYSVLDHVYHTKYPLKGSTTEILADIQNNYYGLPYINNTAWQLRFSHLVGYGAKYYSYLVSRALAHLIWRTYFDKDPLSRVQGEKFRKECLAHGGGKHPKSLITDYLSIEPSPKVLANSLIEEIENHQELTKNVQDALHL